LVIHINIYGIIFLEVCQMTKLSKFYSKEKTQKMIERRYKNCVASICLTLKNLIPTKAFQSLKLSLRSQGWKDWHILLGIFNFVMNYRIEKIGIKGNRNAMIKFQETYPYIDENENSIKVPLNKFTEENLKFGLEVSMPATIYALGLSLPKNVAIKKENLYEILNKFNYWEDDVDHEPLFDL